MNVHSTTLSLQSPPSMCEICSQEFLTLCNRVKSCQGCLNSVSPYGRMIPLKSIVTASSACLSVCCAANALYRGAQSVIDIVKLVYKVAVERNLESEALLDETNKIVKNLKIVAISTIGTFVFAGIAAVMVIKC